ncbi:MAG TPA: effector immunity protein Tgi2PP [Acidobacteriaceae bacterium]|nr:effector immunity protein Tgi2PP [Acidobacteriaceae bacterium]
MKRCWILSWLLLCGVMLTATAAVRPGGRDLTFRQARQIAVLVAHHDGIDLSDTHIELNSMDLSAAFVPGFYSFILIRESSTPGPDETLRRFAISRRTGDVWEMTLCTHYDFPELRRMRRALGKAGAASDVAEQGRQLGCAEPSGKPAS